MNTYNYAGIDTYDINNGKGFGVTFFVQGCPHHCPECHNPETWDFRGGKPFDEQTIDLLNQLFKDPNIVRLTISGGEPFANATLSIFVACLFKQQNPDKSVWIYTGYSFKNLHNLPCANELLEMCDVLVDGNFQIEKKDLSLPFRGSSNQRIIDMNKTRETGVVSILNIQ